jgi:hypothetical protein
MYNIINLVHVVIPAGGQDVVLPPYSFQISALQSLVYVHTISWFLFCLRSVDERKYAKIAQFVKHLSFIFMLVEEPRLDVHRALLLMHIEAQLPWFLVCSRKRKKYTGSESHSPH